MKKFIRLGQFNRLTFTLLILGLGIGLLITTQWKTKVTRVSNPVTPYVSLQDTQSSLNSEQESLKNQITDLQNQISEKQQLLKKYSISKQIVEDVEKYKKRVGLTEIKEGGITIKMDDSHQGKVNIDSITHAADLRDLVNFLWAIGAEAISINGERIVSNTSIDCIVNTILINSTRTTPPFEILAIGDSKTMFRQLSNDDNLKDIKKRVKSEGMIFEVTSSKDITIPAYQGGYAIESAKIVE